MTFAASKTAAMSGAALDICGLAKTILRKQWKRALSSSEADRVSTTFERATSPTALCSKSLLIKRQTGSKRFTVAAMQVESSICFGRRSLGTGKSIALLHVLARLHSQENDRTIIWLGNDVTALPGCFRWARPLLQNGREVLIGLDDPFPADREYDLTSILTSARQELSGLLVANTKFTVR